MKKKKCHILIDKYTIGINPDICKHYGKPYWDKVAKIIKFVTKGE